jgi:hypothetical protein
MKRLFVALFIVAALLVGLAWAVPFHNSNQSTLAWDVVTTDVDGDPITGVVTYKMWLANADTDPNKTNPVVAVDGDGDDTNTQAVITLGTKGRYFVGCQALLDDLESEINWADEPENMEGSELFGLRFAVPPHGPKKIRR